MLGECKQLSSLYLSVNGISDFGAGKMAGVLGECKRLTHFDFRQNGIGAEGAGKQRSVSCCFILTLA